MNAPPERPSARRAELHVRAYAYVLEHGLTDLSLRPLATAVGSSPRVLLFLFDSKDELVAALLRRARADELAVLDDVRGGGRHDLPGAVRAVWGWLADPAHRPLLVLWTQAYARSLTDPLGPWAGFARATVEDWLTLLGESDPRCSEPGPTLALAVLRGALLDLLATGEVERATAAVEAWLGTKPS